MLLLLPTGCEARFINHSCNPNCDIEKWNVLGEWRIGIFANRDIPAGEELSYDYNFQSFGLHKKCYCGEPNCRGFLTSRTGTNTKQDVRTGRRLVVSAWQEEIKRQVGELKRGLAPRTRTHIIKHRVFLARNFERVRQAFLARDAADPAHAFDAGGISSDPTLLDAFRNKLAALATGTTRSIRTRTVAVADDDEHLEHMVQLAHVLRTQVHAAIVDYRGQSVAHEREGNESRSNKKQEGRKI